MSAIKEDTCHTIKVGTFELQTKSFWITVIVSITLFVFGISYITFSFAKYCIDKNCELTKTIILEKTFIKNPEKN